MTKQYLIWDFDGTLGYRLGRWTAALVEVLQREVPTCDVTVDQLRSYLQAGFPWHTPEQLHPTVTSAHLHVYPHSASWRLFADTIPTLARLSAQGWTHLILSNHVPELRSIIRYLQLGAYMSQLFNSAETGYEKPHPQAFRHVLDALDGPAAVWMVGDSMKADITGATLVGIPAILVRTYHPDAKYCCAKLSQIFAIVNAASERLCPKKSGA